MNLRNQQSQDSTTLTSSLVSKKLQDAKEEKVCYGESKVTETLWYASTIPGLGGKSSPLTLDKVLPNFDPPIANWSNAVFASKADLIAKNFKKLSAFTVVNSASSFQLVLRHTMLAETTYAAIHKIDNMGHGVFSRVTAPRNLKVIYGSDFIFPESQSEFDNNPYSVNFLEDQLVGLDARKRRNLAGIVNHSYSKEVYDAEYWFASDEARSMVAEANSVSLSTKYENISLPITCYELRENIPQGEQWLVDYSLGCWLVNEKDEPAIFIKGAGGKTMNRNFYLGPIEVDIPGLAKEDSIHLPGKQRKKIEATLTDLIRSEGENAYFKIPINKNGQLRFTIDFLAKDMLELLKATEKSRKTRAVFQGKCKILGYSPSPAKFNERAETLQKDASSFVEAKTSDAGRDFRNYSAGIKKITDFKAVTILALNSGVFWDMSGSNGYTALHWALEKGQYDKAVTILEEEKAFLTMHPECKKRILDIRSKAISSQTDGLLPAQLVAGKVLTSRLNELLGIKMEAVSSLGAALAYNQ